MATPGPNTTTTTYSILMTPGASRPTTGPRVPAQRTSLLCAALYGLGGGIIGAGASALATCLTRPICHKYPAHIPGYVLTHLLGLSPLADAHMGPRTQIANVLCGGVFGALRGLVAHYGFRGPYVDFVFMGVKVWADQGVECAVGVGRVPWTWPVCEQVAELLHKALWAFVTGYVVDRWVV